MQPQKSKIYILRALCTGIAIGIIATIVIYKFSQPSKAHRSRLDEMRRINGLFLGKTIKRLYQNSRYLVIRDNPETSFGYGIIPRSASDAEVSGLIKGLDLSSSGAITIKSIPFKEPFDEKTDFKQVDKDLIKRLILNDINTSILSDPCDVVIFLTDASPGLSKLSIWC